jgi:hypothetical protein
MAVESKVKRRMLAGAVALLGAAVWAQSEEAPRRVLVTAVQAPTSSGQAGEAVTAGELEIRVGKKPAEVLRVHRPDERPLRLMLIVSDDPGSRLVQNLGEVRQFIESLPEGTSIQVNYAFGGALKVEQAFTSDRGAAAAAVRLPTGVLPPVDLGLLITEAMAQFPPEAEERAQIVYFGEGTEPEGNDLYGDPRLNRAIRQAQERGLVVWTIHTGSRPEADPYLDRLSKETGGRSLGLAHPPSLAPLLNELRGFLDQQYLVEFVPPEGAKGKLEVRLRGARRPLLYPDR